MDENIQLILRQTDYNEQQAKEKLIDYNNDPLKVIRAYLGITEKKALPVKSVNQEIYKQLRYKLDGAMRDYQERIEKGESKKII
jgi:hypothetical protein